MKKSSFLFNLITLPVDIVMIISAFALGYYVRSQFEVIYLWPFVDYLKFILLSLPLWIIIFSLEGLYNIRNPKKGFNEFYTIIVSVSTVIGIIIMWLFLTRITFFSRLIIVYSWFFCIFFIYFGRLFIKYIQIALYKNKIGIQKLAIIGNGKICYDLIKTLSKDISLGYEFSGIFTISKEEAKKNKNNIKILGDIDSIAEGYKQNKFDVLILSDPNVSTSKINQILDFCDDHKIFFKEVPNLFQVKTSNAIYSTIGGIPIINFRRTPLEGWGTVVKRIFDIIISIFLIIISSPIMFLVALAIKIDSQGPVFFVYKRIGKDGKPFTYFKFRSMVENAHKMRYSEEFRKKVKDMRGWNEENPMIKYINDPRITKVGRFIRKYSLDELPEFFLVFMGRMSMVGPRPHEKEEVEKYKKNHKKVLAIKPGITGMAQVSGRSDLTFDDEVRLDIYYIENWSIWLDFKILFKTPFAILQKRKAL